MNTFFLLQKNKEHKMTKAKVEITKRHHEKLTVIRIGVHTEGCKDVKTIILVHCSFVNKCVRVLKVTSHSNC